MEKTLISLTSHGVRLKYVSRTIFSILKQANLKIVLTLFQDDVKNIPEDLQTLIDTNVVELIIAEENLCPHLKYYYAMKKYKDYNVITIDDDCLYSSDFISSLFNYHIKNPNTIIARRAHLIMLNNGKIKPYNSWKMCIKSSNDNRHIFATGVGGILYPANILDVDKINLTELKQCLYADDIFLKVLENRKNIEIKIVNVQENHPKEQQIAEVKNTGLCKINVIKNRNDEYIKLFENELK